ncbi:MAG: glycosyl hydrolase family 18 protein [Lachnospiraceae bacterium]
MKRKSVPILAAALLIMVLWLIIGMTLLIKRYTPGKEKADLNAYFNITREDQMAIILDGQQLTEHALYNDDRVYVEYETLHDGINSRFYWDQNEGKLLYTTSKDIWLVEPDNSDYYIGNKKIASEYGKILILEGEKVYVNLDYIKENTALDYEFYSDPYRVVINTQSRTVEEATIKKDTQVRYRGGIKSEILTEIQKNQKVIVLEKGDKWSNILTRDGFRGYIKNSRLGKAEEMTIEVEEIEEDFAHEFLDEKITMAWHQVTNTAANGEVANILSGTKGVNVISPTWFYLNDSKGSIASLASADYVNYCHAQGVQVWALVSNLEDSSVDTTQVLTTTTYRESLVSALISKAIAYKLDGINVDMEALSTDVGDGYIQFIRELSLKCHANGIILSVDNYVPSSYTAFYQRAEQAVFADYVVIMAYDEHYAGSEAGSVSSIGYVQDGIKNTLKEVPKEQIILGLPFYTRVWELTPKSNDAGEKTEYKTASQAVGMQTAENMAKVNGATPVWNKDCAQYYAEYENSGKIYQIWMEEEESLTRKLQEAEKNELAGVSFWKLGFEKASVWNTILKYWN